MNANRSKAKKLALENSPADRHHILVQLADAINDEHSLLVEFANAALTHAINAGELLLEAKSHCAHGQWGTWLENNFTWSARTASAYMRIARHRDVIEANRQSSADMTIEKALDYIAPKQEKTKRSREPDAMDLLLAETRKRQSEDGLVKLVQDFDEMAETAQATGITHEQLYQQQYAECADGNGELCTLDEHTKDVESWRSEPWFEPASERVALVAIKNAETCLADLMEFLGQIGATDDLAEEVRAIRDRIERAWHEYRWRDRHDRGRSS